MMGILFFYEFPLLVYILNTLSKVLLDIEIITDLDCLMQKRKECENKINFLWIYFASSKAVQHSSQSFIREVCFQKYINEPLFSLLHIKNK